MYIPSQLTLQWHITERCNNRCLHCYQEQKPTKELPFEGLLEVLKQYKNMLKHLRSKAVNHRVRGHINVTGGEPFVRKDFLDLLEIFAADQKCYSYGILCNGSHIDREMARRLRLLKSSFVQLSIEGSQEMHDTIRGQGDFERTVTALENLVRERVKAVISFTAFRKNYQDFSEVARLGRRIGVARVWTDRLIPCGNGAGLQSLTPNETKEFFEIVKQAQDENRRKWLNRTEISMQRALQFHVGHGTPYSCKAGDTLITVQPNGDLYPCRRMPIKMGNLMEMNLEKLYYSSQLFQSLRDTNKISEGCQECFYARLCRGGLKCLSFATTGNPFQSDPGCWLVKKSLLYSCINFVTFFFQN